MRRGIRSSIVRATLAVSVVALGCAPLACGALLGIDSGSPFADGSVIERADSDLTPDTAHDTSFGLDGTSGWDGASVSDGPSSSDGSSVTDGASSDGAFSGDAGVPAEAGCTPDLSWCNTHCGSGFDNCHQTRDCPTNCTTGEACVSNVCTCQSDPNWCNGRCLDTTNNCGVGVKCPPCPGTGICYSGVCGCMAEPPATSCGTRQCGQVTNNCSLPVNCGVGGTTACPNGQVCLASTSQCCTPDNAAACGAQCQVTVTNNCGEAISCPQTCPNNGVCMSGKCCIPNGCGGNCLDNCGQKNSSCCIGPPDAGQPPPDGGGGPPDGGGCLPPNASCNDTVPCCSGACGYSGTCVPMCGKSGGPCNSSTQCCYGLACGGGPLPLQSASAPASSGGMIIAPGTCN